MTEVKLFMMRVFMWDCGLMLPLVLYLWEIKFYNVFVVLCMAVFLFGCVLQLVWASSA